MNLIFDSHAHYDDKAFDEDRHSLLASMPQQGVCGIINAATDIKTSRFSIELAQKYPYIWATVGVHPEECVNAPKDYIDVLKQLLNNKKAVAIGEIGLDYYWEEIPRNVQKRIFEEQLVLAKETNYPVVIHDREAHGDTMELLRKYKPTGLMHCFSGSVELSREVIKLGMSISLGGVVTFKNARHSVEVAKEIPLDKLLLETDCPYLTPVPFRGKRCDSSLIKYTAEKIAQVKNISVEELLTATKENALKLFNISM